MSTSDKLGWFKSSHSGSEGDNCVEIALDDQAVRIRDSKDKRIRPLTVTPEAWAAFVAGAGEGS